MVGAGLLFVLAPATPGLVRRAQERRRAGCTTHLKQMRGALRNWARENRKTTADTYSLTNATLFAFLKGAVLPVCPAGGRYSPGTNIADAPTCNFPGHTL